jgi:hypothetical protein
VDWEMKLSSRLYIADIKPWLLACLLFLCFQVSAVEKQLVISTAQWSEGYTSESGDGLYEELLRTVYSDYELKFIYTVYQRSKALVKIGDAHIWLCAYMNEEDFALYPQQAMDKDFLYTLKLRDTPSVDFEGIPENVLFVWMVGYQYDKYFPDYGLRGIELSDLGTALKLLESGKVDYFIGDDSEIVTEAARAKLSLDDYELEPFAALPVYPGFGKSPETARLMAIWDTAMVELINSGELHLLFEKHGLLEDYPF